MKKALKIVGNILLWLVVIFALLITILVFSSTNSNGVSNLMGYIPLTVDSQSMSPTFNEGDLIICKQIDDVKSLEIGDVITFWTIIDGQKVKNTHRIVRINDTGTSRSFVTRGDNNPIDDEMPAYQGDLIGKWTNIRLTGAGNIMAFLRTKVGFFVCILIPMALFFLFELYKFIVTVIKVRHPDPEPQLDEEEIKRRAIEEYLAEQKAKEEAESAKKDDKPAENDKAEDKKSEEKKDDKPAENDKAEDKKSEEKKDDKPAENDKAEDKKSEEKKDDKPAENDKAEDKKSEEKKDDKPAESDKAEDKKSEEKKDDKPAESDKAEDKKPEEKKDDKPAENDKAEDKKPDSKEK